MNISVSGSLPLNVKKQEPFSHQHFSFQMCKKINHGNADRRKEKLERVGGL